MARNKSRGPIVVSEEKIAPPRNVNPNYQIEQAGLNAALSVSALDVKAADIASVIGPKLQRHLTGQSVMDATMEWIANNGGADFQTVEYDTSGIDSFIIEQAKENEIFEAEIVQTRDRFAAMMSGLNEQNAASLARIEASKNTLSLSPSQSTSDSYALPEAWDGEGAEEVADDD